MKLNKKKKRGIVIAPSKLKDYTVLELIELGEKNNRIELANLPKKNDSVDNKDNILPKEQNSNS